MNWLKTLVDAIGLGSVYALVAIGLALIFGVMRLVNFAHGELIAIAAYLLVTTLPWGLLPAVLVALDLPAMRRVVEREGGCIAFAASSSVAGTSARQTGS